MKNQAQLAYNEKVIYVSKILTLKNVIMKKMLIFGAALALVMGMASCDDNHNGPQIIHNAVKDYDGNKYDAVKIGKQVWMAENLRTTHYADGKEIPLGTTFDMEVGYRYVPGQNEAYVPTMGYFYNWPAVMNGAASSSTNPSNVQGVCPKGWHVPSDAEWYQLIDYVQSNNMNAKDLASVGGWNPSDIPNTPGFESFKNNSLGFNAGPFGGFTYSDYEAGSRPGPYAVFYSSTLECLEDPDDAMSFWISYNDSEIFANGGPEVGYGYSVRCVKD